MSHIEYLNESSHLHDDELQEQRQAADVTGRQVEQKGCVPNRIGSAGALRLFSADDFTVLTQVDDDIVIYTNKHSSARASRFI